MTEKVIIKIKYKHIEKTITASPEETWRFLRGFFKEFIPSYKIAEKLTINVDIQKIAKECEGLIVYLSDQPIILKPNKKLTDTETIFLWLLVYYLGNEINIIESKSISTDFFQSKLKKSRKIIITRLNELAKNNMIKKISAYDYALTYLGISLMQKEILSKIKLKYTSKNR